MQNPNTCSRGLPVGPGGSPDCGSQLLLFPVSYLNANYVNNLSTILFLMVSQTARRPYDNRCCRHLHRILFSTRIRIQLRCRCCCYVASVAAHTFQSFQALSSDDVAVFFSFYFLCVCDFANKTENFAKIVYRNKQLDNFTRLKAIKWLPRCTVHHRGERDSAVI